MPATVDMHALSKPFPEMVTERGRLPSSNQLSSSLRTSTIGDARAADSEEHRTGKGQCQAPRLRPLPGRCSDGPRRAPLPGD